VGDFPLHKVKGKKPTHRQPSVGCVKGNRNSQFFLFSNLSLTVNKSAAKNQGIVS
jgi:hypothetical protein